MAVLAGGSSGQAVVSHLRRSWRVVRGSMGGPSRGPAPAAEPCGKGGEPSSMAASESEG